MSRKNRGQYEFGLFRLDVDEHILARIDGDAVGSLPEKAFQTLRVLVENPGHLVTKQELLDEVWPDSIVEENNVDKCIYAIRSVLGEKPGEQHYIETVRKHGYRFVAEVRAPSGIRAVATAEVETRWSPASRKSLKWVLIISALLFISLGVIAAKLFFSEPQVSSATVQEKRLTTEGGVTRAVVSHDGRYAAVVQNAALILHDLETGEKRVLVPAQKDVRIPVVVFQPVFNKIYYGTRDEAGSHTTIYSLPIAGGEPTRILDDIYGSPSFSPDAGRFTFVRRYAELNEYHLLLADADGTNIQRLASSGLPNRFDASPNWSPDGKKIVCPAIRVEGGFHFALTIVDVETGKQNVVPGERWTTLGSAFWLSDSSSLIMAGQHESLVNSQVWRVDTNTGIATRITNDAFEYETIGATPDGRRIAAVKVRQSSHVWVLGDQATQLTAGFDNRDGVGGLAWAHDGIFYHSRASGRDAIWRMQRDGTNAVEITPDTSGGFAISPDGRFLVYQGKQSADHLGLNLRNLADGSERPITQNMTAMTPSFFPDSQRLVFAAYDKKLSIHEVSIDKGPPVPLNAEFRAAMVPAVSPSGRLVAFAFNQAEAGKLHTGIAFMDSTSRKIITSHRVQTTATNYEEPTIGWSPDESEVYFILLEGQISNIVKLRLADGTVSKVTNFTDGRIFNFAVEPGRTRMLVARGLVERDAALLMINNR